MIGLAISENARWFRVRRYIATMLSLWIKPVRQRPISELSILLMGLIARLAPLAAFILTIQFAVWLISPERTPQRIRETLRYDTDPFLFSVAIISIPILVFFLGGIAQKVSDHLSVTVRRETAYKLVEDTLSDRISTLGKKGPQIREFFVEIRMDYQTVHRSVNSMNSILNSFATVMVAVTIGLMIAPLFMIIVLTVLSMLAGAFIIWRHGETMRLLEQKQRIVQDEIQLQKDMQRDLEQNAESLSGEDKLSLMRQFLANGIGNPNELDDRFKSDTNFISAFGPIIGVMALLVFLAGESEVTEERAAQLIMLVLVLRFCIGNIQSMVTALVGLTRDYVRLARICHSGTKATVPQLDGKKSKEAS